MTKEQRYRTELMSARLVRALREKRLASALLDDNKDQPELERKVFIEMARLARIEADCYEAIGGTYG